MKRWMRRQADRCRRLRWAWSCDKLSVKIDGARGTVAFDTPLPRGMALEMTVKAGLTFLTTEELRACHGAMEPFKD